jgi:hypothetical protein
MTRPAGAGVAIVLGLVGVLMAVSTASAQALFRAVDLQVYDSTGKQVGRLLPSYPTLPEVLFRTASGHTVIVTVRLSRMVGEDLYFPQPACGGVPFLFKRWSSAKPVTAVIGGRQTVYAQTGSVRRRTMASTLGSDGQCTELASPVRAAFVRAQRLELDLADYFTPPFALRATPGEPILTGNVDREPLETTDRLMVRDATGKKVAPVGAYAVVTDSGATLPLTEADNNRTYGGLVFESTDCSGQPYIGGRRDLVEQAVIVGDRLSIWVRSGEDVVRTVYSGMSTPGGACHRVETVWGPGPNNRRPGLTVTTAPGSPAGIDLMDYFVWPFTVVAGPATRPVPGNPR